MSDCRDAIIVWSEWLFAHLAQVHYTEGPLRMTDVHHPGQLPMWSDCASTITCLYAWAGAPDPNGNGYDGLGFTGTLVAHGLEIALADAQPGDVIIYGPGTGVHAALVVIAGADPMTLSHGSDPMHYVRVSAGCPVSGFVNGMPVVRALRFPTMGPISHYPPAPPKPVVKVSKVVTVAHAVWKLPLLLAAIVLSPVTSARNVIAGKGKLAPVLVAHPSDKGTALCYVAEGVWQGLPDQAALDRLEGVGVHRGAVSDSWWATAHQEPW